MFKKIPSVFLYYLILVFVMVLIGHSCKQTSSKQQENSSEEFQSGDPVLQGISQAINNDPNNAENFFTRASLLYDRELYDPCIRDIKKALSIDSSKAQYYHLLSDAYLDYFKSGEALDIMEKAAERFPERIPTLLKLAELQLILKLHDASFFTIQKILNLDKENADGFFMMGMVYRAQGDVERAINSFQSAVEIDPEITDAWMILGDLFADKDFKIAERYYDNAIRLDPLNIAAYHAKAFYLQNNNRVQEAIEIYKIINEKDPQYSDAYLNTGILYLEMDSLGQAFEHFNIMAKIEPQNYLAYYYRGITRMFQGDTEQARIDLEQCLTFNSGFEKANQALEQLNTLN